MAKQIALLMFLVVLFHASWASAYIPGDDERPKKLVNFKAGIGAYILENRSSEDLCTDAVRAIGQLGLQTARYPWTAELLFYTNLGFEAYGGYFTPFYKMKYGWLAFSVGPFYRATLETVKDHLQQSPDCSNKLQETLSTFGAGASIEYLTYRGTLGFYLEVKQSVIKPVFTWISVGVDVSPLIWLIWRNQ